MRKAKQVVRDGYDRIADGLARAPFPAEHTASWIARATEGLRPGARILDLGCGQGNEYIAALADRFDIVGVDISMGQLHFAAARMPNAALVCADIGTLELLPQTFDAVVALYSMIHIPREEHEALLRRVRDWLRPEGKALIVLGSADTPAGYEDDFLGAPMYWSHFDTETNLRLLRGAGLEVVASAVIYDPIADNEDGAHLFALCRAG